MLIKYITYSHCVLLIVFFNLQAGYAADIKIWLKVFAKLNNLSVMNESGIIINKNNDKTHTRLDFEIKNGYLYCNGQSCPEIFFHPLKNNPTKFVTKYGVKLYDGSVSIKLKEGRFHIINTTELNSYLVGVLGSELGESFSIETLKAQAVVSRTYLYLQKEKIKYDDADICDIAGQFQAYGGLKFSGPKVYAAITQTENMFLKNKNPGFIPFFHSTCGGMLLTAAESWSGEAVKDIPGFRRYDTEGGMTYCSISPFYTWSAVLLKRTIRNALQRRLGFEIKGVKFMFNSGGFLDNVKLYTGENSQMNINGYEFKAYLEREGINRIRSVRFKVSEFGPVLYFRGKGFGHLVGMCQWGAEGMARVGFLYKDILRFYYPDSVVIKK